MLPLVQSTLHHNDSYFGSVFPVSGVSDNGYYPHHTPYSHHYPTHSLPIPPQHPHPSHHHYNLSSIHDNAVEASSSGYDCYYTTEPQHYSQYDLAPTGVYACPPGAYGGCLHDGGAGGKQRKGKDDKICGVCGDRALSYNFDAISCESCKAFFRRNAPKGLDYFKCPYDERCRMDVSNRRFCKRCRLNKCFEIGMRKEYILTEEEKAQKRLKIEANRSLRHADIKPHALNGQNEVSSQTVALRLDDVTLLDELLAAYRASVVTSVQSCERDLSRERASMADLVNIAELSMRRVIAMTKQINAFRVLPQDDQIRLLKSGSIELLILRSVITFDAAKQQFLDPFDEEERAMKLDQLERAETGTGLFEEHMKFVKSLTVDLKADETSLIILLVIALFSPDRENVASREYVGAQQERYCLLLRRYLESRCAAGVARALFPRYVMKLTEIRSLNKDHSHVLLKLNPEGIEPLMKEVLDLTR